MIRDTLTTARLKKRFNNNFDLCNFAISIGRALVKNGEQPTIGQMIKAVEDRAFQEGSSSHEN